MRTAALCSGMSAVLLFACPVRGGPGGAPPGARAAERIALDDCVIAADAGQASFVRHAVGELAAYLAELTGKKPPVGASLGAGGGCVIVVGPDLAAKALGAGLSADDLGQEGYVLKSAGREGATYLVAAGAAPAGTKHAVYRLMKRIRVAGGSACVDGPLDVAGRPAFAKRGMHFNGWAFSYPYTFRGWREEDWRRYLDILSCQGVNLLFLWPFMEIIPLPLSRQDRAYLEECRRLVDYAQKQHGMDVWLMQCTNRVARDDGGEPDPRLRRYWTASQVDLNPGDPGDLRRITASRGTLYRIVSNADGVCNIDSDPGSWPGSPLGDYVRAMKAFRALLDEHNVHGRKARLINWMWAGWSGARPTAAIPALGKDLPEPWLLISGRTNMLGACRQHGVLGKTVLLPYNLLEGEPSYPATNVTIDRIGQVLSDAAAGYPGLLGAMGNVQTPLLQFPNVYAFTSATWDPHLAKRAEADVLAELARHLYPQHAPLVAECFAALKAGSSDEADALASKLDDLAARDKLGRAGVFGRKLFPDHKIVAGTLVMQLRLRAAHERLSRASPRTADAAACERLLSAYCDALLTWDSAHGWWKQWGRLGPSRGLAAKVGQVLGTAAAANAAFDRIDESLAGRHGAARVRERLTGPLRQLILGGLSARP